jgi:hypothetical protein
MDRSYGVLSAEQIVDAILEADDIGDFVEQGLADTDPFHAIGPRQPRTNGVIEVWHHHTGANWEGKVRIEYDPNDKGLSVYASLDSPALKGWGPVQANSYWTVEAIDLPVAHTAVNRLIRDFDKLTDLPPASNLAKASIGAELEKVMLVLDDVFFQTPPKV